MAVYIKLKSFRPAGPIGRPNGPQGQWAGPDGPSAAKRPSVARRATKWPKVARKTAKRPSVAHWAAKRLCTHAAMKKLAFHVSRIVILIKDYTLMTTFYDALHS